MNVLVFTNMYPSDTMPFYGSFVRDEVDALRRAGIDVDVYFVNGRARKLNYAGMPAGFARRVRAKRYDVVHVHHSFCGFVATMQRTVPVVWTFHEGEISGDSGDARMEAPIKRLAYAKGFKRRVARNADAIIVVAKHLAAALGRNDAVTISSGIDMSRFAPMDTQAARGQLGLVENRRYVLFPSSPSRPEKRYDLARAAIERLGAADVELVCLDNVPHADVPVWMSACELMLMTSAFEASPVTVREALCCNVPVVTTDVGDVRDVLAGIDGCHVVDADVGAIADAVKKVLLGPHRLNVRDRLASYSLESTAERVIAVYKRVIAERKDASGR